MSLLITLSGVFSRKIQRRKNQIPRSHLMNMGLMSWNLINSLELHSPEMTPTTADSIPRIALGERIPGICLRNLIQMSKPTVLIQVAGYKISGAW
ncbi:hypothetical protein [Nostoc sp.]|uniref:hypothetical protein n=1 Tax=Nostoc sp. TaxID=1180 RepID=UPI002FF9B6BF